MCSGVVSRARVVMSLNRPVVTLQRLQSKCTCFKRLLDSPSRAAVNLQDGGNQLLGKVSQVHPDFLK